MHEIQISLSYPQNAPVRAHIYILRVRLEQQIEYSDLGQYILSIAEKSIIPISKHIVEGSKYLSHRNRVDDYFWK